MAQSSKVTPANETRAEQLQIELLRIKLSTNTTQKYAKLNVTIPSPAVNLELGLRVCRCMISAAGNGRNTGAVQGSQYRRDEPVLGIAVTELPVFASSPRAYNISSCKNK